MGREQPRSGCGHHSVPFPHETCGNTLQPGRKYCRSWLVNTPIWSHVLDILNRAKGEHRSNRDLATPN